ncbi:Antagonist of MEN (Mitotic Exit Network) [Basidiobolus ranarum]|uniref:Antagonist of MEN (Mitotic Exit Network) n=1 Tax=Basidiobolus ranarum TaxID=34480 RepID=A0ABR2W8P1_9FUNG
MALASTLATECSSQALELPDLLTVVFKFLATENSLHPCLSVSRFWNQIASRILWMNLTFSNETKLESFIQSLPTTSEVTTNAFSKYTRSFRLSQLKTTTPLLHLPIEKFFTRLESIEFFICHNLELEIIHTLIKLNPNLSQVKFPGCVQVDDNILLLLATYCPNLEHLDLRACSKVTDHGITAIARSCRKLSFLNIGRTSEAERITDTSFIEIAQNTNILTIGASGCNISDLGLITLIEQRRGALERVSLNNCSMITDHSLTRISQCVHLSVLEVKGCTLIRNMKVFQHLRQRKVFLELCLTLNKRFRQFEALA